MTFRDKMKALKTKPVTVYVIGGAEYAGTLADTGDDWIEIDPGASPPGQRLLIPLLSIVCVAHR
jgi:hypothetical protein